MVDCLLETTLPIDHLREQMRRCSEQLIGQLKVDEAGLRLAAESDLWSLDEERDSLFILRDGTLSEGGASGALLQFETGDILGWERLSGAEPPALTGRFGVILDRIRRESLLEQVLRSPESLGAFSGLLSSYSGLLYTVTRSLSAGLRPIEPNIKAFRAGDVLIQQGEQSTDVLTIVEGRCRVDVDGVAVGSVGPDEIVGALAFLTEHPRNATVTAEMDGLALIVTADSFSELLKQRPETVTKLLRDMAVTIDALDKRLVMAHIRG